MERHLHVRRRPLVCLTSFFDPERLHVLCCTHCRRTDDRDHQDATGKLAENFDSFLTLLTTQLQNQDPLSPMDSQAFTQQLVQFTSVEQSIKTNDSLGKLISLVQGSSQTSALGYLGATVEAKSDKASLGASTPATIAYELPSTASSVSVRILDSTGHLVAETRGPTTSGAHEISWDGTQSSGARASAGLYRIEVDAKGADGKSLKVAQMLRGKVDSIDPSTDPLMLTVAGVDVGLTDIKSISRAQ